MCVHECLAQCCLQILSMVVMQPTTDMPDWIQKNAVPLPQMYINVNFIAYSLMHKSKHSALIVTAQENKMVRKIYKIFPKSTTVENCLQWRVLHFTNKKMLNYTLCHHCRQAVCQKCALGKASSSAQREKTDTRTI